MRNKVLVLAAVLSLFLFIEIPEAFADSLSPVSASSCSAIKFSDLTTFNSIRSTANMWLYRLSDGLSLGWSTNSSFSGYADIGDDACPTDDNTAKIELSPGNYAYVYENSPYEGTCGDGGNSYSTCKNSPAFAGEITFSITQSGGSSIYSPRVNIISPNLETTIGQKATIQYETFDDNDFLGRGDGLKTNPVSIYFMSGYDILHQILIAEGLPASGIYTWETSGLKEGVYRIIIKAEDTSGLLGEAISKALNVDNSKPVFIVRTEPPVSRGEDVRILVDSSEDLAEPPSVIVIQRSSNIRTEVAMKSVENLFGQRTQYEGIYSFISGYDGPAKILASGKDLAGNIGDLIVSGGVLNIGINPPPRPVILSPFNQEIVASGSISITGTAREDTKVILLVNGKDTYTVNPEASGSFDFKEIKLDGVFNQGLNVLSIVVRDATGNESEATEVSVKYNIAPEGFFKAPLKDEEVSGVYQIGLNVSDENKDRLEFTYEVSHDEGKNWALIVSEISPSDYSWNTRNFFDGPVMLKATVDDGFERTIIISDIFFIRNFSPVISFTDGDRTFINKKSVNVDGLARGSEKDGQQFKLTALEYSVDRKKWIKIMADDGSADSFEKKFSLNFSGLKEGVNTFLFRAKDSRGVTGQVRKTVVVDLNPPAAMVITSIKEGEIVSDKQDRDKNKAGVQFNVSGTSEPDSIIEVLLDGITFSAKTDSGGFFDVPITLTKHGKNNLKIKSIDRAGNESEEKSFPLLYNNPPDIKFLKPRANRGLNRSDDVQWKIEDPDGDAITNITLSYRPQGGIFKYLNIESLNTLREDILRLPDGNYQLRLEAEDVLQEGSLTGISTVDFSIDNKPPTVFLNPFKNNVFTKKFNLQASGRANDDFSGVEFVEFSIAEVGPPRGLEDRPRDWFKATLTRGFLGREASFVINKSLELDDGEHELLVRSVDAAGNLSLPVSQKIIIDTKPPRVGSYTISDGPITLLPEGGKFLVSSEAVDFKISLEADTKTAVLVVGEERVGLVKNNATGLWDTKLDLNIETFKNLNMKISAEDINGNKTEDKEIGEIKIVKRGKVSSQGSPVDGAKITVQIFDQDSQSFVDWQAKPYGRENPIYSDTAGEYKLLLPAGKYQMLIQKKGFNRLRVSEFNLEQPRYINFDLELEPREGIRGAIENFIESF